MLLCSAGASDAWFEGRAEQGTWAHWLVHAPGGGAGGPLARAQHELRTELRAAVRHAYLGPQARLGWLACTLLGQ